MAIKELRSKTGLSQSQFAKVVNVPVSTLRHWEQGDSQPPTYVLVWLEKALKYDKLIQ